MTSASEWMLIHGSSRKLNVKNPAENNLRRICIFSDKHIDFKVNAHGTSFRAGMSFKEQNLER